MKHTTSKNNNKSVLRYNAESRQPQVARSTRSRLQLGLANILFVAHSLCFFYSPCSSFVFRSFIHSRACSLSLFLLCEHILFYLYFLYRYTKNSLVAFACLLSDVVVADRCCDLNWEREREAEWVERKHGGMWCVCLSRKFGRWLSFAFHFICVYV